MAAEQFFGALGGNFHIGQQTCAEIPKNSSAAAHREPTQPWGFHLEHATAFKLEHYQVLLEIAQIARNH